MKDAIQNAVVFLICLEEERLKKGLYKPDEKKFPEWLVACPDVDKFCDALTELLEIHLDKRTQEITAEF